MFIQIRKCYRFINVRSQSLSEFISFGSAYHHFIISHYVHIVLIVLYRVPALCRYHLGSVDTLSRIRPLITVEVNVQLVTWSVFTILVLPT
jgi:hypothetical protein